MPHEGAEIRRRARIHPVSLLPPLAQHERLPLGAWQLQPELSAELMPARRARPPPGQLGRQAHDRLRGTPTVPPCFYAGNRGLESQAGHRLLTEDLQLALWLGFFPPHQLTARQC